jgi:VanZ family protein
MRTDRFAALAIAGGIMLGLLVLRAHPVPAGWDKVAHASTFALIAALLMYGTAQQAPLLVLAAVVGFGALDEVHQLFVAGRTADLADFIADATAAAVVVGLLWARKESTSRKEKPCVELSRPLPAATSSRS